MTEKAPEAPRPDMVAMRFAEAEKYSLPGDKIEKRECCACDMQVGISATAWEYKLDRPPVYGCLYCFTADRQLRRKKP